MKESTLVNIHYESSNNAKLSLLSKLNCIILKTAGFSKLSPCVVISVRCLTLGSPRGETYVAKHLGQGLNIGKPD